MATRDLTSAMATAVQAGTVKPAIFYEGDFDDGAGGSAFVRLWSGLGTYHVAMPGGSAQDWIGAGNLLGINAVRESTSLRANSFEVWLTGMSTTLVAAAMTAARKNRSGKLWLALFDLTTDALLADPYLLKRGRFDTIPIADSGDDARITCRYEDRLARLAIPLDRRWTTADQAIRDPADHGFDMVPSLQDAQFLIPAQA